MPEDPRTPESSATADVFSWSAQPPRRNSHEQWTIGLYVVLGVLALCGAVAMVRVVALIRSPAPVRITPSDIAVRLVPSLGANGPAPNCADSHQTYEAAAVNEVPSNLLVYDLAKSGLDGAAATCWDYPNGDTYQVTLLGYDTGDEAQSAAQLIGVSTLVASPTGTRQTIGGGEAFSVAGPGATINIEYGFRDNYVFVVEAVNAGAPEVPVDDVAQQQYARL